MWLPTTKPRTPTKSQKSCRPKSNAQAPPRMVARVINTCRYTFPAVTVAFHCRSVYRTQHGTWRAAHGQEKGRDRDRHAGGGAQRGLQQLAWFRLSGERTRNAGAPSGPRTSAWYVRG